MTVSPATLRRFHDHKPVGDPYALPARHPAVIDGVSLFHAGRARHPDLAPRLLKSGHNNRKIGKRVMKGRWAGMPIYTLTLEERATCPLSCKHWRDCYGNKMNWPMRWEAGAALEARLDDELRALAREHRKGFVVRLHVLGDFYSVGYVERWLGWLLTIPQLHVWGYSAWAADTRIGAALAAVAEGSWGRFAVRLSNAGLSERGSSSIYATGLRGPTEQGIVCPVESGDAECCATCGLCWQSQRNIVFLAH